jgi:hypothetical protein
MRLAVIAKSSFLVVIFLIQGCIKYINVNHTEIASKVTSEQIAESRVAVMPAAGRRNSNKSISTFEISLERFMEYTDESSGIIKPADVRRISLKNPGLLTAYEKILKNLTGFDKIFSADKKSDLYKVNHSRWGSKDDNVKIYWSVNIKREVEDKFVLSSAARQISEALDCDYLLVPVIEDGYHYAKTLCFLYVIPSFYGYNLDSHQRIALYLVDGRSGQIVRAAIIMLSINNSTNILNNNQTISLVAASLQKILGKGWFAGMISLEKW